ncbi:radical SAM/SPASM domain-containing protein [Thermodesulfobacteriota bacterium]
MIPSDQTEDIEAIKRIGLKPPVELCVMITTGCNLQCRHCWPQADSIQAAVSIIPGDFHTLVDNFVRLGVRTIYITGGEPLTHPDCYEMLAYAATRDEVDHVCLQTNGTQLTTEQIAGIKGLPGEKIRFQVSMEGARAETHDAIRGKGSFEQTVAGLRRLGEMGLGHNITAAFTETQSTIEDLPDLLALVESLGVGQLVSGCLVIGGRALHHSDLTLPRPDQYVTLLDLYHQDTRFKDRYDRLGNFAAIEWFKGKAYPLDNDCRCMRTPYITPSGTLYPCSMLPLERWRIDGLFKRPFSDVIAELLDRWQNIPGIYRQRRNVPVACQSCSGSEHCGGGCLGRVTDVEGGCEGVEDRCELRQAVYSWKVKR